MLQDKVIMVTGGAGLLGKCFSQALLAQGAKLVMADLNLEAAQKAAQELAAQHGQDRLLALSLDITSKASIQEVLGQIKAHWGKLDVLVNNAYPRNKNYGRKFFEVELEDFNQNLGLHLGGYFLMSQQTALFFQAQGYGNIINIASIYGVVAPRFEVYEGTPMSMPVEYAAIKSGLIHLTKYMAKYFKGMNIRVNSLSPGGIFDRQPEPFLSRYRDFCANKGMLDKEDLAGALVFLASDQSKFVQGQNLIVDDGFTL